MLKFGIRTAIESFFRDDDSKRKTSVQASKSPVSTPPNVNIGDADFFKAFLLEIYQCSKPFDLVVVHTKPKTRMGTYAPRFARIRINDGWGDIERCKEIAIHEYAHHIHYTEKAMTKRKEEPHGKQFWQIYGQLILLAKQKGLYSHPEVIDI